MTDKPEITKNEPTRPTTQLVYLERILLNQILILKSLRHDNHPYIEESEKTLRGEYDV